MDSDRNITSKYFDGIHIHQKSSIRKLWLHKIFLKAKTERMRIVEKNSHGFLQEIPTLKPGNK